MTHTQQRPSPQQTQTTAPAVQPVVAEPTNALSMLESGLTSVASDIGAEDWVEAARKMGTVGTVVLDAMPVEMALPRVHELWDLAYVRDWVHGLDPATIAEAAPGLALQLIDELWPVGVALGMDAALQVTGSLGPFCATNASGGLTEVMRDTASSSVASAAFAGDLTWGAGVDGADMAAGGFVDIRWDAPLAASVTELLQLLWSSVSGASGAATDAMAQQVAQALAAARPVWSVGAQASAETLNASQAAKDMAVVEWPLDALVGDLALQARTGARIEGDESGTRAVFDLSAAAAQLGGLLDLTAPLPEDLDAQVVFDLADGALTFASAVVTRGEDHLEFQTAEGLAEWVRSLVMGGGAAASMAEALRGSGLSGLSRSVRRELSWTSDLVPDGLLTGMAMMGEPELVLEARVDADRLAASFDKAPYPVDMMALGLTAEDGLRAALDVVRGQRPPGWWTLTDEQLAVAVDLAQPRIQCALRAQLAQAEHVVTDDDEYGALGKMWELTKAGIGGCARGGPAKGFSDALVTGVHMEIDELTDLRAQADVGATARMDVPVEAPTRSIWKEL